MRARHDRLFRLVYALATACFLAVANRSASAGGGSEVISSAALEADFRGCESARLCRFWAEALTPSAGALLRVRPSGVRVTGETDAIAARDRLNALLSNMIHQHKRIELRELHRLGDDLFAALIIVNGSDVAADPVLRTLGGERAPRTQ